DRHGVSPRPAEGVPSGADGGGVRGGHAAGGGCRPRRPQGGAGGARRAVRSADHRLDQRRRRRRPGPPGRPLGQARRRRRGHPAGDGGGGRRRPDRVRGPLGPARVAERPVPRRPPRGLGARLRPRRQEHAVVLGPLPRRVRVAARSARAGAGLPDPAAVVADGRGRTAGRRCSPRQRPSRPRRRRRHRHPGAAAPVGCPGLPAGSCRRAPGCRRCRAARTGGGGRRLALAGARAQPAARPDGGRGPGAHAVPGRHGHGGGRRGAADHGGSGRHV
ncbi:MAG: hypothetical protein AVDCRST_MAG34-2518, partial [uncultured Nocardioidaceae bacterium]